MIEREMFFNCSYIPLEIIAAAGYSPVRNWPADTGTGADHLLPSDFCPYSRALLTSLQDKVGPCLLADSCDAMRRVYDVLDENSLLIEVPRDGSRSDYYRHKLAGVLKEMQIDTGEKDFQERLKEAISRFNHSRNLLQDLRDRVVERGDLSFTLIIEGVRLLYQHRLDELEDLMEKARGDYSRIGTRSLRIIISSSCLLDGSLVELVEKSGLQIVGLDSCLGERSFNFGVEVTTGDQLESLARSYLNKPACPRMMDIKRRIGEVEELISGRRADGLIYFLPKFCDLASYDFKVIKDRAEAEGLPVLLVEGEYHAGESGQLNTRVTAFKESLEIQLKGKL